MGVDISKTWMVVLYIQLKISSILEKNGNMRERLQNNPRNQPTLILKTSSIVLPTASSARGGDSTTDEILRDLLSYAPTPPPPPLRAVLRRGLGST